LIVLFIIRVSKQVEYLVKFGTTGLNDPKTHAPKPSTRPSTELPVVADTG
jgi:hypothetical protein